MTASAQISPRTGVVQSVVSVTDETTGWHHATDTVVPLTMAKVPSDVLDLNVPHGRMVGDPNHLDLTAQTDRVSIDVRLDVESGVLLNAGTGAFPLLGIQPARQCRTNPTVRMSMRTYELRTYFLTSQEHLEHYVQVIYPRHLSSALKHGLRLDGFWTSPGDAEHRLFVLASCDEGADPAELGRRYMQSQEFHDDLVGFDPSTILKVEVTTLVPGAASPMR